MVQGIGHFIVHIPNAYQEEYELSNGEKLIRSHLFNDFENATKQGEVIATVKGSGVPVGATLYFHHAIVDTREGGNVSETYLVDKEKCLYRVPYAKRGTENKAYAWEKDGEIQTINDWILLKQVREDFEKTESGLYLVEQIEDTVYASGEVKPKKNHGEVVFLNDYFKSQGIEVGDELIHKDDAEYPMEINGEVYWRVWEPFLLAKVV